jgi:hypothetical protein
MADFANVGIAVGVCYQYKDRHVGGMAMNGHRRPVLVSTNGRLVGLARPKVRNMEHFIEEVIINERPIRLTHEDIPLDRVQLDEDNPRIRYRLKMEMDGKSLEEVVMSLPEVRALRKDIEKTGGLRERVIVQKNGDGKFKVVEGNCRTVCIQSLHHKAPHENKWKKIQARILPEDVDPRDVAILLSDFHVAGKIAWKAHEKAGQVYHMVKTLGMDTLDVATYLRTSKATINRWLNAYGFMVDRFLKIEDGKYGKDGERKWSYFEEFYKKADLVAELKLHPEFADDFCRWVGEGKLQPVDVRDLSIVLKHPEARKKLEKGGTFAEAIKIVNDTDPEQGSDFFKMLAKMRESCSNAAQVKEILRIRSDKVARAKVLDTYKSLVDFMKLADVELPKDV